MISEINGNFGFSIKTRLGDSEIILAARCGDLNKLRTYFDAIVEKFGRGEAKVMLSHHCNKLGKTILHELAQNSRYDCVKYLLENCEIDADCLKQGDWTPLMLACTKNNLDIVKLLVINGADLTLKNKDGWTPFHIACREDNKEIVKFLLHCKPDIWNTKSKNGRTPLHTAALYGRLEVARILVSDGGYLPDEADNCGSTPLMDSLRTGNVEIAKLLTETHKANCSTMDSLSRQALHLAAQTGQVNSVDWLLNTKKINPNIVACESLMTPAHFAAKENHINILKLLQKYSADLTLCDSQKRSPLHLAASGQHGECVGFLLNNGVHDTFDVFGKLAQDYAKKSEAVNAFCVAESPE